MSEPSEDMVEIVARAIYEASPEYDWDQHPEKLITWDDLGREAQAPRLAVARAAITAMREPTEAMADKGWAATGYMPGAGTESTWQAMIDAALASGGKRA